MTWSWTTSPLGFAPVVPDQRAHHVAVLREVVALGEGRHHAPGVGHGNPKPRAVLDGDDAADPIVLDEAGLLGVDDQVHPEETLVEATAGSGLAERAQGG